MKSDTTHSTFAQPEAETAVYLFDDWFDPIETCVRDRVREFIQAMIEGELDATLLRPRYGRLAKHAAADKVVPSAVGHRHGRRSRSLTGTFGRVEIEVPRARLEGANGKTTEWQSKVLRAYQRRTLAADALIASTYLSGTNTRRVRRALKALFGGAVSKDTVSRIWRKVKADWESWNARSLADASGGSSANWWRTAWRQATVSSPSRVFRQASGAAPERRTQSSACTRSSNDG